MGLVVFLQTLVERFVSWNEDIGEWQLKCVAYTGNNMRKQVPLNESGHENDVKHFTQKFFCVFL